MYNVLRFYNQNRIKIWGIIIFIIFILIVIQLLNRNVYNKRKEANLKNQNNNIISNEKTYEDESVTITSSGSVNETYQKEFGNLIDQFFTYCVNHEPEKAYGLLSSDIKRNIYQTENLFEKLYYETKFTGSKQYSFQSWSKGKNSYIYIVKIFDNMLETGKTSDEEYIEDYITITQEDDDVYALNVGGFIDIQNINKDINNDKMYIKVKEAEIHMDYATYSIEIKNNSDMTIYLNDSNKTDTVYLLDNNKVKYIAFLYENTEEEFTIKPRETKTISVKFNITHRENLEIESMTFEAITIDQQVDKEKITIEL